MALEALASTLLPRLLAASVQAAVLVGAILLLCHLAPRLAPAVRAMLWWLVAAQMVVGLAWSSPLALPLWPVEAEQPAARMTVSGMDADVARVLEADSSRAAPAVAVSPSVSFSVFEAPWSGSGLLALAWLSGLGLMAARTLGGYLATRRLLRDSHPCRDRNLMHALQLASEAHGLRRAPRLRLSAAIDSPQLVGPWAPVLVLPADHVHAMHDDELDMALTHELVHLQRGDLWWGLLPAVAQHLFFFHPLAHLAVREYALAREAACDAAVIAGSRHCAHDYGRLLLRLGVAPRPSAGLASASPTFRILKRRLLMLQHTASTPRIVAIAIIGLVAVLGVMPYRITAAPASAKAVVRAPTAPSPAVPDVAATAPVAPAVPVPPAAAATVPAPPAPPPPVHDGHDAPPAPPPPAPARSAMPAPPAPPAALVTHGTLHLASSGNQAYVLLQGGHSVMNASTDELRRVRRMQAGGKDLLWFRKGNAEYMVRDPALLARFRENYAEVTRLGRQQGAVGARQGEIGQKQGIIGQRQGALGLRQAELASRRLPHGQADARAAELDRQQAELDRQQSRLHAPMAELDRQQALLGEQMRAADARAQRGARTLMEQAIATGAAQPVRQ